MNSKTRLNVVILAGFVAFNFMLLTLFDSGKTATDDTTPALHQLMGTMQPYMHKYNLSVLENNRELAGFYLHELEEVSEEIIENIEEYDGHPVSSLAETMFLPAVEQAEATLNNGSADEIRESASLLIQSCNNCHKATEHGYIKLREVNPEENPFNQDFSPSN
ncbi:MAG TPA: hypothetical protein VKM36_07170 [Balneolaceae bacterium]|nr:hypothetical protein [Balneolaceae bacterium]